MPSPGKAADQGAPVHSHASALHAKFFFMWLPVVLSALGMSSAMSVSAERANQKTRIVCLLSYRTRF